MRTLLLIPVVFAASACTLYFGSDSTPDHQVPDAGFSNISDSADAPNDGGVNPGISDANVIYPPDAGSGCGSGSSYPDAGVFPELDAGITLPDAH